ncbi:MAG: hypothetical protein WC471_01815 [Candidatus Woesearchaeota archaeon]
MKQRGQITLFIVLGLVLLLIAGLYYMVSNIIASSNIETEQKIALDFNQKADNVNFYTTQCIKKAARDSIELFGMIGSMISPEQGSIDIDNTYPVTYLRINDRNYLPTIENWEDTLSYLSVIGMASCNFSDFEKQGLTIEKGKLDSKVIASLNNIVFDMSYPITIKQGNNLKTYSDYSITLPIRLGYIHNAIDNIIKKEIETPGYIPVSKILTYNINITTIRYDDKNTIIYIITDDSNRLKPYTFQFADKDEVNPLAQ